MLSADTSTTESQPEDIEESITEDIVRGHLVEMGYEPDALPDNVLAEFVQELKILYREELECNKQEKEIVSKSNQKIIKQDKNDRGKKPKQAWDELDYQFANLDLDGFKKTAIKQRELLSNCSSPISGFSSVSSIYDYTQYRYCLDNSDTPQNCEEPLAQLSEEFLYGFWQVVYWITFNIQMFIVPVMQGYVRSGGFTFKKRLYDGIMENIIFYAAIGVPSIGFLLYAIFGLSVPVESLLDLAIPASNAYGLVLLTLFMSFGLVEIPRGLWVSASVQWKLRSLENEAPQIKESCVDAEAEVYEVARCPLALTERNGPIENTPQKFTEADLISLKARIVRANFLHVREQA
ncbi:hypothetical protein HDV01_003659 [Terramyces sp. JEL0728]|nr:hypothetical protein HDV01_003659 [Terramyces sp. JEL0728]